MIVAQITSYTDDRYDMTYVITDDYGSMTWSATDCETKVCLYKVLRHQDNAMWNRVLTTRPYPLPAIPRPLTTPAGGYTAGRKEIYSWLSKPT